MKINESNPDRIIRAILGVAIIAIGYATQSWWGAIGLIPLVTALVGICPVYSIFGVSTSRRDG